MNSQTPLKYVELATRALVVLFSLSMLVGCRPPPDNACQGARVSWPFLEFDETADRSEEDGVQVDLDLRTTLPNGTAARLILDGTGLGGEPLSNTYADSVDTEGALVFKNVTLFSGEFSFRLEADVDCGTIRTERSAFLQTSDNDLRCTFEFSGETQNLGEDFRLLEEEADLTSGEIGIQAMMNVDTGLAYSLVDVFVFNEQLEREQVFEGSRGFDTMTHVEMSLSDGFYSVRAVCEHRDITVASPTLRYKVQSDN